MHTIAPVTGLPPITDSVTIDGFTQPGSSANTLSNGNNAVLPIRLAGENGDGVSDGLSIESSSCVVRGLAVVGHGQNGIAIRAGVSNRVEGCYLGLEPDGATMGGNGFGVGGSGLFVVSSHTASNTLGGLTPAPRNVTSANSSDGIRIVASPGNRVLGNYIGTDASGTFALGNLDDGVDIGEGAEGCVVGSTAAGARNLSAGNGWGIYLNAGGDLGAEPRPARGVTIQGNYIGVDVTGTARLDNNYMAVLVGEAELTLMGGSVARAGNLIAGGNDFGLLISGGSTTNTIQGNVIGTDPTGIRRWGSPGCGIGVEGSFNHIGGTAAGEGNVIADYRVGIVVTGVGNAISRNSIFGSLELGIDLGMDGFTPNDQGDADNADYANGYQNFPELTSATVSDNTLSLTTRLDSTPGTAFRLEFFANEASLASGYSEGCTYLGSRNVTTSAAGTVNVTVSFTLPAGQRFITATATDPSGNTSEFSPGRKAVAPSSADLTMQLMDSEDPVGLATNVTYGMTVSNDGPASATGVIVRNRLPFGLTFVSATTSQGSCSNHAGLVTCRLGTLARDAVATLSVVADPVAGGTVEVRASVYAEQADELPENNQATASTVLGLADLALARSAVPNPAVAGQRQTNTLVVSNLGPDDCAPTVLWFYWSGVEVDLGALTPSQGTVLPPSNLAFEWNVGALSPGGTARLDFVLTALSDGLFVGACDVLSTSAVDPNPENNRTNFAQSVAPGPGVIAFLDPSATVAEGDTVN